MDNRKIDTLVAKHIIGWNGRQDCSICSDNPRVCGDYCNFELPNYSENIGAAWKVVEKLNQEENLHFKLDCGWNTFTDKPYVSTHFKTYGYGSKYFSAYENESAPMAICLAALKAKGIEVNNKLNNREMV